MQARVSDLYDGAADYIERYGHVRGHPGDPMQGFCAIGAMQDYAVDTFGEEAIKCGVYDQALDLLDRYVGVSSIVDWSDESPTPEVIDGLRRAAKTRRLEEEATSAPLGAEVLPSLKGSAGSDADHSPVAT